MSVVIWSDGRLYGPDEPLVTGVDHGLTVGDGVFETCAVYGGAAFALSRHLRRLRARPWASVWRSRTSTRSVRASAAVLAAAGPDTGRLRITLTGGVGPLGSNRLPPQRPAPEPARACRSGRPVAGVARRAGAVGAQRAVRRRRAEDDVLRRERRRGRRGVPARCRRGRAGQHRRRALRGHRVQRLPWSATASWSRRRCPAGASRASRASCCSSGRRTRGCRCARRRPGELRYEVLDEVVAGRRSS